MDSFVFVITSIVDTPQRTNPNYQTVVLILFLFFMERLSLLLPHDQYGLDLTSDQYEHTIKQIVAPFSLTSMLFAAKNDILTSIFLYIALLSVYLFTFALIYLTIAYKYRLYDPIQPQGIYKQSHKIIYSILMYIEYLIFVPITKLFLGSVMCGENSLYQQDQCQFFLQIPVYLALTLVMFYVTLSQFFFRSYQIDPPNKLKRKYNDFQLLVPFTTLLFICVDFLTPTNFNITIRLISANLQGICWMYKVYEYNPFVRPYNKYAFLFASQYQTQVIIFSLLFIVDIQIRQLFYYQLLMGTLMWFVFLKIYDIKLWKLIIQNKFKSQYQVLYMIQNLQYLDDYFHLEKEVQIQWYYTIINHMNICQNVQCKLAKDKISRYGVENQKHLTNIYMNCLIIDAIESQQQTKSDHEFLQITLIWFQALQCQQELPAFLTLRKYQNLTHYHSFYFKCICTSMHEWLKSLIIKKQRQKQFIVQDEYDYQELTVLDIYNCQRYDEIYIPKFKELLEYKIKFWEKLLTGFQNVVELAQYIIRVSSITLSISEQLEKEFDIELTQINPKQLQIISQLKLLSFYFSAFLNDEQSCIQLEQQADEILTNERSVSQSFVTNTTLINSKVVLMHISTIKNRGNFTHSSVLTQFFGYSQQMFDQIFNIDQLMPEFIKKKHPAILDRYLSIGVSDRFITSRTVYIIKQNGFLMAANIRINNFFQSKEDYILSASFNKVKENQDYFLFNSKGKILGMTQNILEQLQNQNNNLQLRDMLQYGNIFVLFPDLIKTIQDQKEELIWNDQEQIQLEYRTNMRLSSNLIEEFTNFKKFRENYLKNAKNIQKSIRVDIQYQRATETWQQNKKIDLNELKLNDGNYILGCYVQLLDQQFIQGVSQFNQSLSQDTVQISYYIKYKILGNGENSYPYFYFEINDFKLLDVNHSATNSKYNRQNITQKTKFSTVESQAIPTFVSKNEVTYHPEDVTLRSENAFIQTEFLGVQQQNQIQQKFDEEVNILIDSSRIAPLSLRANFNNPLLIQTKLEIDPQQIDQRDIIDFQNDSSSKDMFRPDEAYEYSQKIVLSSQKEEIISRQIKTNIMKNEDRQQNENQRSIVSQVTTTSNSRDAIFMMRSIKHNQSLNYNLKIILIIFIIIQTLLLASMITKITVAQQYNTIEVQNIQNIVQPYNLKARFNKISAIGQHHLLYTYKIINSSEFIKTSIQNNILETVNQLHSSILTAYDVFIVLENEGLIDKFDIYFIDGQVQKQQLFSNYFFLIREQYNGIIQGVQSQTVDQYFIDSLFFMKLNAEQEFKIINQLLEEIFAEFLSVQDLKKNYNLIIFMIFICFLLLILILQMQFWMKLKQFKQRILVNMTRITEKQALQSLAKYNLLKEILIKESNNDWRKVDYQRIVYNKAGDNELNKLNTELGKTHRFQYRFQTGARKQTYLNSQYESTKLGIARELINLSFVIALVFGVLFGGYYFQYQQDQNQSPTQRLTLNFIQSSLLYEENVLCALISKLEYITVPFIKNLQNGTEYPYNYLKPDLTGYYVQSLSREDFRSSFDLKNIYDSIINSNDISTAIKQLTLDLFSNDLCIHLSNEIEFCNLKTMGQQQFIQKYGEYESKDNNLHTVQSGIVGEYTNLYNMISENYEHELENKMYLQNKTSLLEFINSKNYLNCLIQYFLCNSKAHSLFITQLVAATIQLLNSSLTSIVVFYSVFGIFVMLAVGIIQYYQIQTQNRKIYLIRLGVLNLPMELLIDNQMKQVLRIIQKN